MFIFVFLIDFSFSQSLSCKNKWNFNTEYYNYDYLRVFYLKDYIYRVNSPNTGCLPNIGNGPQSGPPLYSKAEGRFAALHFIMGRRAAKRPINLQWEKRPRSGPSVCNAAKGRKVAHHCVDRPKSGIW